MSAPEIPDVNLRVLYDFEYDTKDERKVSITEGERLFLIKKTNPDWWQVIRSSRERPFFVPAKYVEIFDVTNKNHLDANRVTDEIKTRDTTQLEENGNASLESVDYFREESNSTPTQHSIDDSPSETCSDANFESPTEDVRRILFDKRKSWAVEELLSELTQGRSALAQDNSVPAPEPEPDYEMKDEPTDLSDEVVKILASNPNADSVTAFLSKHGQALSQDIDKIDLSSQASIEHLMSDKNTDSKKSVESGVEIHSTRNAAQAFDALETKEGLFKVPQLPNNKLFKTSVSSLEGGESVLVKRDSVKSSSESVNSGRRDSYSKVALVKRDSANSDSGSVNGKVSYARVSLNARDSSVVKRDSVKSESGSADGRGSYARVSVVDDAKGSRVNVNEDIAADDGTRVQRARKGPKVTQLSESLEKLAQQIQFTSEKPAWVKKPSRSFEEDSKVEVLSRSCDELDVAPSDEDIFSEDKVKTYPNKMFLRVKNKIQHSSSFKTKKEMEKSVRKRYVQDADGFDVRASVSGMPADRDLKEVTFTGPPKEKNAAPQPEKETASPKEKTGTSSKEKTSAPSKEKHSASPNDKSEVKKVPEIHVMGLQSTTDTRERRGWRDIILGDGEPDVVQAPARRSSRDSLDTIGEANILRDVPETAAAAKLNKIAIGFQNPSYRPISHSLDNFHDPAVLAMHDKLCTALGEQHGASNDPNGTTDATEKRASKWSRVRQMSQKDSDKKVRNFHKLKTSIEKGNADVPDINVEHADDRKAQESLDELVFGGKKAEDRSRSGSNTSDDAVLNGEGSRRKTSLSRTNRVESIRERHQLKLPLLRPPSPSPDDHPSKTLPDNWAQYHTHDGRTYYYCSTTGDKSWKPPRKHGLHSESEDGNSSPTLGITVPSGWQEGVDDESGLPVFVHHSGAKWFSSSDIEGRLYFFEENSANSSWTLPSIPGSESSSPTAVSAATTPTVATTTTATTTTTTTNTHGSQAVECAPPIAPPTMKPSIASIVSSLMAEKRREDEAVLRTQLDGKPNHRMLKTRSMVLVPPTYDDKSPTLIPPNWPHLFDGNMKINKEGPMHRTKITEHGKKVRKNWSQSYVVLTELFLLFYSDIKHAIAMKNGTGTGHPELCFDLSGANIERADKLSSRKNVFVVSTQLGHQVLIQCDSSKTAEQWYHSIHTVIALLPRNENSPILAKSSPEVVKKPSRLGYSRSMRIRKDGSMEDLTNPDERQTKIRARLKKFFVRRPTKESLVKKGIYKDEPMFGRNLSDVVTGHATVPQFVVHCIEVIESKEENMKADGLYRVSGNLSQVQKIRLQADQNNLLAIDQEEDVHVLTGALKLFFRELKKPLIPCEHFSKALKASSNPNKQQKLQQFREIVKALPAHNRATLHYLLQHLLRVAKYKEFNRMHIPNVAIVFGPSLMWPEEEELGNMAIDLMQQNLVVECLLVDFDQIFK